MNSLKLVPLAVLFFLFTSALAAGTTFDNIQIIVMKENGDKEMKDCQLLIDNDHMSILRKNSAEIRVDYPAITKMVYEKSAHPRWKTAVFLSPWALLSKGKKHWLTVNWKGADGSESGYFIIKMDKNNYRDILAMAESKVGMVIERIQEN